MRGVFAVIVFAALAACGADDSTVRADTADQPDPTGPAGSADQPDSADLTDFCAHAPDADDEVSAEYVGSTDHVDDMQELADAAPAELGGEFDLIVRYFDDAVDPAEPESQMVENFPDEVNAAVDRVVEFIDQNCGAGR